LITNSFSSESINFLINKDIIFCDVDNTVCESCCEISRGIATTMNSINKTFIFISGTDFTELKRMLPLRFPHFLLPNSGAEVYFFNGDKYIKYYTVEFKNKDKVISVIKKAIKKFKLIPETPDQILDRGSQITLSCIGRTAPKVLKDKWDKDLKKRKPIAKFISKELCKDGFTITIGGTTSVDVGIGKKVGLDKFINYMNIDTDRTIYIGDKLSKDGNDYPASFIMDCVSVESPSDFSSLLLLSYICSFMK